MKVYALIFSIGISSGYKELIGIFDSIGKAEDSKNKHMKKYSHAEHHYKIKEIEINKIINDVFMEW